jgi:hypothetical protein
MVAVAHAGVGGLGQRSRIGVGLRRGGLGLLGRGFGLGGFLGAERGTGEEGEEGEESHG